MKVKVLTGLVPEWFTPTNDEGEEYESKFRLKPLTAPALAQLQGHFDRETGEVSGVGLWEAAKAGVVGWENVTSDDDETVRFSAKNLELLPYTLILKLGARVLEISFLSDKDEKN